ncbi:hypothetical protein BH24CHL5_BH24CHL5_07630 [soil metagenome]
MARPLGAQRVESVHMVPWPAWALLALAALSFVIHLGGGLTALGGALLAALPLVFAAGIVRARPVDRRWVDAALLITLAQLLDLAQAIGQGFWFQYLPSVMNLVSAASFLDIVLLAVAVVWLALAAGRVRTPAGWAILALGVVVTGAGLVLYITNPASELQPFYLAVSLSGVALPVLWAWLAAAALDAGRRVVALGAGLLLLELAVIQLLTAVRPGPGSPFGVLIAVVSLISIAGWLALTYGAWRGELAAR